MLDLVSRVGFSSESRLYKSTRQHSDAKADQSSYAELFLMSMLDACTWWMYSLLRMTLQDVSGDIGGYVQVGLGTPSANDEKNAITAERRYGLRSISSPNSKTACSQCEPAQMILDIPSCPHARVLIP